MGQGKAYARHIVSALYPMVCGLLTLGIMNANRIEMVVVSAPAPAAILGTVLATETARARIAAFIAKRAA